MIECRSMFPGRLDPRTRTSMPQDPASPTQPSRSQPTPRRRTRGWLGPALLGLAIGAAVGAYLLLPFRTNLMLLGIDRAPAGTDVSRSDTMILMTFVPSRGYVGMLSIPRDLWVGIPGVGKNRINAAHFFGEASHRGGGPVLAQQTVESNLGVGIQGWIRIRFDAVSTLVDALGGVQIDLPVAQAGLSAGPHWLNGKQALAFVRDRKGSDDFFRMARGQLFIRSIEKRCLDPRTWPGLIAALPRLVRTIDTDVPAWDWPRLALLLLQGGWGGIDGRLIDRTMATPTTAGGADVLLPNWSRIRPFVNSMFEP